MSVELKVPALGESVSRAVVGVWLKKEGEAVAADEPVVEVESEKATVVLPAPAAGVLARILRPQGTEVAVGEAIGLIEESSARAAAPAAAPSPKQAAAGPRLAAPISSPPPPAPLPHAAPPPPPPAAPGPVSRLSPSARRRQAQGGAAAPAAALALATAPAPSPPPPPGPRERAVPMSPLRRTVARRLLEAQSSAAILTTFNELDLSRVLALRERHGPAFLEKHGVKLGFMGFFVRAAVEALRAFPAVNAEIRGNDILYKDHYDLGVAVGGGKGLVVPVIRDADQLGFAEIEKTLADLAKKARESRITMEELDSSYSGVVLTFEPGPEFKKGGQKASMAVSLRRRLARQTEPCWSLAADPWARKSSTASSNSPAASTRPSSSSRPPNPARIGANASWRDRS